MRTAEIIVVSLSSSSITILKATSIVAEPSHPSSPSCYVEEGTTASVWTPPPGSVPASSGHTAQYTITSHHPPIQINTDSSIHPIMNTHTLIITIQLHFKIRELSCRLYYALRVNACYGALGNVYPNVAATSHIFHLTATLTGFLSTLLLHGEFFQLNCWIEYSLQTVVWTFLYSSCASMTSPLLYQSNAHFMVNNVVTSQISYKFKE